MAQTVIGFFDDAAEAQSAVRKLTSEGFRMEDVDTRDRTAVVRNDNARSDNNRHDDDNSITGFFKSLFSDNDDEADRYTKVAQDSCCIVTVHAQSKEQAERAADIMDSCGAVDVDERSRQYNTTGTSRGTTTGRTQPASTGRENREGREETTIPKMEEKLNVGKRVSESSGGVRVRSRIVERPVEEHVRLREEHVNVERQPVNRPVSSEDMRNFQDKEVEFRERKEVPVVNKEARVVEEVKLSKDVTERQETIRDTVRHTEVDVDKIRDTDNKRTTDRNDRSGDTR